MTWSIVISIRNTLELRSERHISTIWYTESRTERLLIKRELYADSANRAIQPCTTRDFMTLICSRMLRGHGLSITLQQLMIGESYLVKTIYKNIERGKSMNRVDIVGRLYQAVDVKTSQSGKSIARTGVAVQRKYKNSEGKYDSDFINVIAFGATGDFLDKYFEKGQMIGITGSIQTGSYTNKNGQKVYTTDVVADTVEFVGGSKSDGNKSAPKNETSNDGFMNVPEGIPEELPFN